MVTKAVRSMSREIRSANWSTSKIDSSRRSHSRKGNPVNPRHLRSNSCNHSLCPGAVCATAAAAVTGAERSDHASRRLLIRMKFYQWLLDSRRSTVVPDSSRSRAIFPRRPPVARRMLRDFRRAGCPPLGLGEGCRSAAQLLHGRPWRRVRPPIRPTPGQMPRTLNCMAQPAQRSPAALEGILSRAMRIVAKQRSTARASLLCFRWRTNGALGEWSSVASSSFKITRPLSQTHRPSPSLKTSRSSE